MIQLTFPLAGEAAYGRADFFVSDGNAAALAWLDRWPDWPSPVLLLYGPQGCGKTHLAHLWCARAPAALVSADALDERGLRRLFDSRHHRVAVDDADRAEDAVLLHLLNACRENGGSLLLTARAAPGSWPAGLPDLGSRLRAALAVGIALPDDALLGAVLAKHFADRQVRVGAGVIAYLVGHMERSLAAAGEVAAALDQEALSSGGAIALPLARRVLAARVSAAGVSGERQHQPVPPDRDPTVS